MNRREPAPRQWVADAQISRRDRFGCDDAIVLGVEAGNDRLLLASQQVYDRQVVARVADIVEGAIERGRLWAARIEESVARIERLFPSPSA